MDYLRSRPMLAVGIAVVALLLGVGAFLVFGNGGARPAAETTPTPTLAPSFSVPMPTASPSVAISASPTATSALARCPLDGLPISDAALATRTAIVVQIENHPLARPARGLNEADMVYEAPVEGDTTRFSAVFLCQPTTGLSGPVRSARYYNIDLWQDLHALTVGFGASPGALTRFAAAGMPYVNGITGGWPWYQRVSGREAPHNLYADLERVRRSFGSMARLDQLAARLGGPLRPPLRFDPKAALPSGRDVAALTIQTNSYWRFGWTWDAGAAEWHRQDAGRPIVDAVDGAPVSATSVLVQRVTQEVVFGDPDPGGNSRRLQHLVGHGAGTLYADGRAIAVRWSRPTAKDGTSWTYATGDPVVLRPGRVWVEIVPVTASVSDR